MVYLDASAAVAAITREAHSDHIWRWLENNPEPLFYSGWVSTEVSSALSIKVRAGALSPEDHGKALQSWDRFRKDSLAELAILPDYFEAAARLCDQPSLGLRGGDALHLAVVKDAAVRLLTFDRQMADAALQLGIAVEPI